MDLQEAWGKEQAARGTELLAASWRSSSHSWPQSLLGSPSPGVVVKFSPGPVQDSWRRSLPAEG